MTSIDGIPGLPNLPRPPAVALPEPGGASPASDVGKGGGQPFGNVLLDAVHEIARYSQEATAKTEALARGEPMEPHDLMIAISKSEVAFNLMLEVRNKLVEAWQTLSRQVV